MRYCATRENPQYVAVATMPTSASLCVLMARELSGPKGWRRCEFPGMTSENLFSFFTFTLGEKRKCYTPLSGLLYNGDMAKVQFNCRLPEEVLVLINAEVERLQGETEKKVSQADVVSMAVVRWCSLGGVAEIADADSAPEIRRAVGQTAMREAESKPPHVPAPKANPRSESVAQRKARESKEHADALAQGDTVARMVGRDDIDYDLDNVQHRSVAAMPVQQRSAVREQPRYEVSSRKVTPLARPHGKTEPKRRREQ